MKHISVTENGQSVRIRTDLLTRLQSERHLTTSFQYRLVDLTKLTLKAINLLEIDADVFRNLSSLRELSLDLPKLEALPEIIFYNLRELVRLDLILIRLNWFECDTFQFNQCLVKLVIVTQMNLFRTKLFARLTQLTDLTILSALRQPICILNEGSFFDSLSRLTKLNVNVIVLMPITSTSLTAIEKLNLTGCQLVDLRFIESLANLTHFNLTAASLASDSILRFNRSKSLKVLNLACNQIYMIDESFFSHLLNLRFLNFDQCQINRITSVELGTMCPFLSFLSLRNNVLVTRKLSAKLFRKSFYLVKLDLSFNYLQTIRKSKMFASLRNLTVLLLNNNQIDSFPSKCFEPIIHLIVLDLSNNYLRTFKSHWFSRESGAPHLQTLNLSGNCLKYVRPTSLKPFRNLKYLNLADNSIFKLVPGNFKYMRRLKKLNLTANCLTCLRCEYFARLARLKYLFLNDNQWQTIEPNVFTNMYSLRFVDISI